MNGSANASANGGHIQMSGAWAWGMGGGGSEHTIDSGALHSGLGVAHDSAGSRFVQECDRHCQEQRDLGGKVRECWPFFIHHHSVLLFPSWFAGSPFLIQIVPSISIFIVSLILHVPLFFPAGEHSHFFQNTVDFFRA
jgi:hypothetical protein